MEEKLGGHIPKFPSPYGSNYSLSMRGLWEKIGSVGKRG
jgi:hypothetical protein